MLELSTIKLFGETIKAANSLWAFLTHRAVTFKTFRLPTSVWRDQSKMETQSRDFNMYIGEPDCTWTWFCSLIMGIKYYSMNTIVIMLPYEKFNEIANGNVNIFIYSGCWQSIYSVPCPII